MRRVIQQEKATILCAEDESDLRRDLVEELEEAGYRVLEAANGEEALMAISTLEPNIVLCDINMPKMTGLEILEQVRASDASYADIPFIFLTAFGEKSDMIRGRKLGADDYLVKPVDFDILLATIESRLDGVMRAQRQLASKAAELETKLSGFLSRVGIISAELPNEANLRSALKTQTSADFVLIIASLDAHHRLVPQFGTAVAENIIAVYREHIAKCAAGSPAYMFQLDVDVLALLVTDLSKIDEIRANAARLVELHLDVMGNSVTLSSTLSITVQSAAHSEDRSLMLDDAVLAVRFAQRDGGHSIVHVDEPVQSRLRIMQFVEENFLSAVKANELSLVYQPKIDIKTRAVVGAEALIRWQSPSRGAISPGLFIPIVERSGLASTVSDWVLENVAKTISRLAKSGLQTSISVNASGAELHARFAERVADVIARYAIPSSSLEVEITETSVILDMDFATETTHRLRENGISVAIDDFGTGYSSFSYLRTFPLDAVKVDQSFVRGITTNNVDRQIVESIIGLARAIGLKTIAEGVETREQFHALQDMGCDIAQGYYVAKPMPLANFEAFVSKKVAL